MRNPRKPVIVAVTGALLVGGALGLWSAPDSPSTPPAPAQTQQETPAPTSAVTPTAAPAQARPEGLTWDEDYYLDAARDWGSRDLAHTRTDAELLTFGAAVCPTFETTATGEEYGAAMGSVAAANGGPMANDDQALLVSTMITLACIDNSDTWDSYYQP